MKKGYEIRRKKNAVAQTQTKLRAKHSPPAISERQVSHLKECLKLMKNKTQQRISYNEGSLMKFAFLGAFLLFGRRFSLAFVAIAARRAPFQSGNVRKTRDLVAQCTYTLSL